VREDHDDRYEMEQDQAVSGQTHAETGGTGPAEGGTGCGYTLQSLEVQLLPLGSIRVLNPRGRERRKFRQIVANIRDVGLKKPITVRPCRDGGYELVCGQGRLDAFRQLGQTMVPAIVRDVSQEEMLLMSLVENIARRNPTSMETVRDIVALRERGYSQTEIGQKIGMALSQVNGLLYLYDHGEKQLMTAVETGKVPVSTAVIISRSDHGEVQTALLQAAERKELTVGELQRARTLADVHRTSGRKRQATGDRTSQPVTGDSIVRALRREQVKQRQALKKAELCEKRLVFIVNALQMLFKDDGFVNLLRAEALETVPEYLVERIKNGGASG
jgi:ParB family chromosome partitioning protein